jgi:hypothetical protein
MSWFGAADAGALGAPFACTTSTIFAYSTQSGNVYTAPQSTATTGPPTFTRLSSLGVSFNAMGFNPLDHYLYGLDANQLVLIDGAGNSTLKTTPVTNLPSGSYDTGAFDPSGNLWVTADGSNTAWEINVNTNAVTHVLTLSTSWTAADWSWSQGYLWAANSGVLMRVSTSTGVITSFPVPGMTSDGFYFADWTFANGDLGMISDAGVTAPLYYRLHIAISGSAVTPTIVGSGNPGVVDAGGGDGTACAPPVTISGSWAPGTYGAGTVGGPVSASGGPGPYTFSLVSGMLPPGISLESNGFLSGTPTAAGTYPIVIQATNAEGTTSAPTPETITINPAPLVAHVTGSWIYGGIDPEYTATLSGFVNGDDASVVSGALTGCQTIVSPSAPATNPATVFTGIYGCGGFSASNYAITYEDDGFAVYLAVSQPALAGQYGQDFSGGIGVSGGVGPYTVTQSGGTLPPGLTLNSDGSLTGTATAAGTYTFTVSATDGSGDTSRDTPETVTINKVDLIVEPSGYPTPAVIHYGDPAPTFTPVYYGLTNGDTAPTAAVSCSSDYTPGSPAGTGFTESCTTPTDPNYVMDSLELHASVVPAPLTVHVTGSQTYGGADQTFSATYDGFVNGQDPTALSGTLNCTTTTPVSAPAGSYPAGSISCSGLSSPNYAITYEDDGYTVNPAPLLIQPRPTTIEYGGTVPTIQPRYVGLVNGDLATATPATCSTAMTSSSPVGPYPSSCTGASDPNYSITYQGGMSFVDKTGLVAHVTGSQTYGGSGQAFAVTFTGFVNGDGPSAVSGSLSGCTTSVTGSAPAGTYPSGTISGCGGLSAMNYAISIEDDGFTVNPAPLTVTASSGTMTYGGTPPAITPSYSGLQNSATAPATAPTCSTTATSSSAVGSYPSSCTGAVDPNYAISYVPGSVSVGQAQLTVYVTGSQTFGDASPTFNVGYSGFQNGQGPSVLSGTLHCTAAVTPSTPVGTYPSGLIACSGLSATNYSIAYVDSGFTVAAASLTVTASSGTMTYGGTPPAITASYSGLENGATAPATAPTCSTTATSSSVVGSYPSSCTGAADPNYTISYVPGSVSVGRAPLTVTASSGTMTYGGTPPVITPSYGGGPAPATLPTCSTTATSSSPVGSYPSSCSGGSDPNYAISYTPGSVMVKAAALTATVTGSQTYGGAARAFALQGVTGFVNGQGPSLVSGTLSGCTSTVTATTGVGPHSLTISGCTGLSAPNYTIAYADGGFTVNKAPLTITASSASILYGAAVPAISASYSGFVNGETSVSTPPTCSTTYTVGAGPGTFPSSCSGAAAANYAISYVPGSVTVTGGPTTLTYTGVQQVSQKSTFTPSVTLSSTAASCVAGQTVTFALNVNPTNGAAGPYALGSAKTSSTGVATAPAVSTTGWQLGSYTVTATFAGTPGCLASAATGALAVTTAGLAANGGGKYTVSGAGPVTFGFEASKVGSKYVGQVSLVNDHRWMFVGSVSNYVKTGTTAGYITGTGSLYWWNPTLNHGCGGWVLAASNVSYTATFTATTSKSLGTFGIQISYTPSSSQPGPLPNSAPQPLVAGLIGLL